MNKDVTLKFNLGKLLKAVIIAALFVGVFMLGRWSVDPTLPTELGSDEDDSAKLEKVSFIKRLFGSDGSSSDLEEPVAKVNQSNSTESSRNSTPLQAAVVAPTADPTPAPVNTTPAVAPPAEASVPETIITAYPSGTMAMTLTGVKKEWFETWGRINTLEVSFRNNAQGTIKPSYITMIVEGYDYDKKVPLANGDPIIIKAGQTKSLFVTVPGGWAYNKVTAGDLKSVQVTIVLFDEADVQMASDRKEMNLEG